MRDSKQKGRTHHTATSGERAAKARVGDASSSKLSKLSKKVGNEEIQARLAQGNTTRKELLDFLVQRMQAVRSTQVKEIALSDQHSPEIRHKAKYLNDLHTPGTSKPQPTQWAKAARAYEQAADALCRGDMSRGRDLLERAVQVEQQIRDKLTDLVKEESNELEMAAEADDIVPGQACGPCDAPAEIADLSLRIQSVTTEMANQAQKKRTIDPWWTLEEEEEEEEGNAGAG